MNIEELGKGGLPDQHDPRDYRLEEVVGAPVVDWPTPVMLPDVTDFDQRISDACGPVGTSFYHEQLKGKVFSKRDLSCRTLGAYGSYIRDNVLEAVKGQADNKEVLDPSSPTPTNMRDKTGTSDTYRIDDAEVEGRMFPAYNIDYVAYCIDNFKGCVFGVQGDNAGWQDHENPKPPVVAQWGHLLYAQGHHMHDGKKCIIAKSSWYPTSSSVKHHHIKEDYFANDTFSPWVIIPKRKDPMILANDNGTFYLVGEKGKLGIADPKSLELVKKLTDVVITESTAGIPQVGTLTHDDAYIVHN